MKDAMKKHTKLQRLFLRSLRLNVDDFEELISVSKKKKYTVVR